jgi:hypothetical protein
MKLLQINNSKRLFKMLFIPFFAILLSACGGGGGGAIEAPVVNVGVDDCVTIDAVNTSDSCGTLLVSLTDADGDFLTYTVDITNIDLTRRDGTVVSILPTPLSVDFTDYLDLSELTTAATIPAGIYTSGTITIDYSNANIQVEQDGAAVEANMVDADGAALTSMTLRLQIDQANNLIITRARAALMEFDFNLSASHTVDLSTSPATVTTEPFVIVEVDPVDSKEFRIRGPLISVNEDESLYRIAVRPFHNNSDRLGGLNVHTDDDTNYDINGEAFVGTAGLTQMATLEARTATVAFGVFNRAAAEFTAKVVLAGSSVPGSDRDAARGVIIARSDNTLTVKGASLIRMDGVVDYQDEITVLVAETTKVLKRRRVQDNVTIADLSVGQAVTILGTFVTDATGTVLDATEGAVKMRLTFASGHAVATDQSALTLTLQALNGRRPDLFDFSGTGTSAEFDADPENYEVAFTNPNPNNINDNDPVRVAGFVAPFGSAPEDFNALTVADYSDARSQIVIDWPEGENVVAFSEITAESMTVNIENDIEGGIYKLIQGGIRTDLSSFANPVVIQPRAARGIYALKTTAGVSIFSNFADFTAELQQKVDEGMIIDKMHASGGFAADSTTFSALKLAIKMSEQE